MHSPTDVATRPLATNGGKVALDGREVGRDSLGREKGSIGSDQVQEGEESAEKASAIFSF